MYAYIYIYIYSCKIFTHIGTGIAWAMFALLEREKERVPPVGAYILQQTIRLEEDEVCQKQRFAAKRNIIAND